MIKITDSLLHVQAYSFIHPFNTQIAHSAFPAAGPSFPLITPTIPCLLKKPGDGLFILITTELFLGATHATCKKEYSHLYYDFSYLI